MRQDRRLNGWVMLGSIIQIISSIILLIAGAVLGVTGFLYTEQIAKFKDVVFFVNQEGIDKACRAVLNGSTLETEYLYLLIGIIFAVVALLALITAIVSLHHAKKRRVVRHRFGLFMGVLIPLAIVGCVTTYLVIEFRTLTDNIKYVAYGIIGLFGFSALCVLLGIIFGRSEKFMSNDNNKYGFNRLSMRGGRTDTNNLGTSQVQHSINRVQSQANTNLPQQTQPQRPVQQARPVQYQSSTPLPPRPQTTARPVSPMQNGNQSQQRPITPTRPVAGARPAMPQRPVGNPQNRPIQQRVIHCKKCGRLLTPQEKICSMCGYKVTE